MLWLSKRMLKGLRFLFDLMLDRAKMLFSRRRCDGFAWGSRRFNEVRPEEQPLSGSTSCSTSR